METLTTWPVAVRLLAVLLPTLLVLGALGASRAAPFRAAHVSAWLAGVLALAVAVVGPWLPAPVASPDWVATFAAGIRLDLVTSAMLVLVGGLSIVIVRYSDTYLRGDAGRLRYVRALLLTLACVLVLVITNDLLVLSLAWMGSSLALHQLLTHFRDRTQAAVAAHKKFILSRVADACVLGATALLAQAVGSVNLDAIHAFASANATLPLSVQVATVLLVAGVTLKTAQLPFHGWLTQVMEAPTPVSALLHAGVVNIGGLVLIRVAPLMVQAEIASTLLVIIGTSTAVVAALVMTTRVSVKVNLAWSTAAQMGLMLVQCGLGLWHLALLHLLAHSVYKAHAFLSAGSAVDAWRRKKSAPTQAPVPVLHVVLASLLTVPTVLAAGWALGVAVGSVHPAIGPFSVVLALALAPMLAGAAAGGARPLLGGLGMMGFIAVLYFTWHLGFEALHLGPEPTALSATLGWAVVAPAFLVLFVVQTVLQAHPSGGLARALQPHLFNGLYLDALFTRMTFRVWPPRLPPRRAPAPARLAPETMES